MTPLRFGFPKSARLLRSACFNRVMKNGRKCATDHFVVFVSKSASDRSRLGITVSRQIGNAVKRNRVKRWFREVFRNSVPMFTQKVDVVILARKKADFEDLNFAETHSELEQAFLKLGLCH